MGVGAVAHDPVAIDDRLRQRYPDDRDAHRLDPFAQGWSPR